MLRDAGARLRGYFRVTHAHQRGIDQSVPGVENHEHAMASKVDRNSMKMEDFPFECGPGDFAK